MLRIQESGAHTEQSNAQGMPPFTIVAKNRSANKKKKTKPLFSVYKTHFPNPSFQRIQDVLQLRWQSHDVITFKSQQQQFRQLY